MSNCFNNIDGNDTSGVSIKGKFRERLKLIKINRFKNFKNGNFSLNKFKNLDRYVVSDISKKRKFFYFSKNLITKKIIPLNVFIFLSKKFKKKVFDDERNRFVRGVIRRIKETAGDRNYVRFYISGKKKKEDEKKVEEKNELKIKIVRKLKDELEKKQALLDVLEDELYYVDVDISKNSDIENIKKLKEELNNIKIKIDNIIDSYVIYKDGYCEIDSSDIVDDIIRYKNLGDDSYDYKLLDEYRILYDRLIKVSLEVDDVIEKNDEKMHHLIDSDYRYFKLTDKVNITDEMLKECDYQIKKQNKYLDSLMKKVNDIDRIDYTIYKFRGINELVFNSVKYVSLLMVSPLVGLIPSIAINTLATRRILKKIYKNIEVEKIDKVKYEAINYDFEIRNKLNDLNFTYDMVDDTIKMIDSLKEDLLKEFGRIEGINITLGKLDEIKDKVVGDRYRMDIIKKKLVRSKKINEEKLIKVKKLNNS